VVQVRVTGTGVNVMPASVIEANGTEGGSIAIGGSPSQSVAVGEGAMVTANGTAGNGGRVEVNGGEIVVYKNRCHWDRVARPVAVAFQ